MIFLVLALAGGLGSTRLEAGEPAPAAIAASPASVVQSTRTLTETDVLALLTATLQRDYVKDKGTLELAFTQPWTAITVPDGPLSVKILELPTAGVTSSFIIRFQLCTPQQNLGTRQATVQAHVWREVWEAHSALRRGQPLSGADVGRERCDVLNVREALADFTADDPSLELAEPVPAGIPLLARMIKPRTVIRRGQLTDALLQDGALSITTKVEALEDGALGQIIRARNPVSHRDLTGRVVDSRTILISL